MSFKRILQVLGLLLLCCATVMAAPPEEWAELYTLAYEQPAKALQKADALVSNNTEMASDWVHVVAAAALYHLNRFADSQSRLIDVESRIEGKPPSAKHVITHRLIGQNYFRMGGFDQALNQALKAKLFAEQTGLRDEQAHIINLMAAVHLRSGKFEQALDSFRQALTYFEEINSKPDIAKLKNNVAAVYVEMEQLDLAEQYLDDTLLLATELNRPTTLITGFVNQIELYAKQGRFEDAENSLATCLQLAEDLNLPSYEIWCLQAAAKMYQMNNDNEAAISKAQQAYDMAVQQNLHQAGIELGKLLVTLLTIEERYEQALDMSGRTLEQVEKLRDQVLTLKLDEVKALNEVEQTRNQLQLMRQQNELQQQRQRMAWIGMGVLVPMLIVALILLRSKQRLVLELNHQQGKTEAALEDMRAAKEENERLAKTDHLTGLNNRRELSQLLRSICDQSQPMTASILMIDVDHFKQVNDNYGHNAGDTVLIKAGQVLQQQMPDSACLSRWGGEEFMVLLTDIEAQQVMRLAEQFRATIADQKLVHEQHNIQITVSIGVAAYITGDSMDAWVQKADQALYTSKNDGRNRVTVFGNA